MTSKHIHQLLDRLAAVRGPVDLDLLVFFARHPRTFLTSEQLAAYVGYPQQEIGGSLDALLEAGWLTRSQNHTQTARLYRFSTDGGAGGWLGALLSQAATRAGRREILEALRARAAGPTTPEQAGAPAVTRTPRVPAAPTEVAHG